MEAKCSLFIIDKGESYRVVATTLALYVFGYTRYLYRMYSPMDSLTDKKDLYKEKKIQKMDDVSS